MIVNNIYCQVSGMVMTCIAEYFRENDDPPLPIVCEIGCADGQGVARYAGFCENVICVDPMVNSRPDIVSYEKTDMKADPDKIKRFWSNVSHVKDNITLLEMCSAWPETLTEVEKLLLPDKFIDILVIDGCHHPFEAVWKDFELYYKWVRPGGYVIFDDLYEDCIMQAYNKAINEYDLTEFEQWEKRTKFLKFNRYLQQVGALKKAK